MDKAQVVKYKCCEKIFAACREPECYMEKDWLKNLKKYIKRGDIVEIVPTDSIQFGKCECKTKKTESPNLFTEYKKTHPNENI